MLFLLFLFLLQPTDTFDIPTQIQLDNGFMFEFKYSNIICPIDMDLWLDDIIIGIKMIIEIFLYLLIKIIRKTEKRHELLNIFLAAPKNVETFII